MRIVMSRVKRSVNGLAMAKTSDISLETHSRGIDNVNICNSNLILTENYISLTVH